MNPNTKIFWNGKLVNWKNQYGRLNLLGRIKIRVIKAFQKLWQLFKLGLVVSVAISVAFFFGLSSTQTIEAEDTLPIRIEALKDEVVKKIQICESAGYKEDDAPIILDTNNKMSIGTFQFQKNTVIHYEKSLNGNVITAKEATLIALDDTRAAELTKKVLFETETGWKNWYNCSVKYNLPTEIALIKKLAK